MYVAATWLYPPTRRSLDGAQTNAAKQFVVKLYKRWYEPKCQAPLLAPETPQIASVDDAKVSQKVPSGSVALSKALMFFASKSAQDEEVEESSKSPIEIEVDTYASVGFKLEGLPDARQVWSLEPLKLRYPVLSSVSQDADHSGFICSG